MPHLVLIGDSVFDNGAYTSGGPSVIQQVTSSLPQGWSASLRAVDGSTTEDIDAQLAALPEDASHLVLSVGGNNALLRADVLQAPVATSGEALLLLSKAADDFEVSYRRMLGQCLKVDLPVVTCTVYHGNFAEPSYQACVAVALCAFNDVIIRVAAEHGLKVIDLRRICSQRSDYANPIEPSSLGGQKIASAIALAVTEATPPLRGAYVVAA
ncbi:SGNH/GDSL hydrolase family protein [Rhizobacter sp. Root1221]|uniref:SGNH/GDSL hydrolase family protein n=1 Tax=Rhizobacter sp. Root1221 TaxID=1736433 RepID=UPI0009EB89B1|nr:SGNH/GDSL hydrolase family protein [Rhizobacter sp. Root1221]